MKKNADLTTGNIYSGIILFAIPIAACSIFQQLLNTTDTAILGSFSSNTEMAAVGDNASVVNLIISLLVGLSVGANIVVAHLIGEKRFNRIGSAAVSILIFGFFCGVLLLLFCLCFAKSILKLMGTPESVLVYAVKYMKIYSLGLPALTVYFFGAAVLRGMGNSRLPTVAVMVSGIVNVILNIVSVCLLHLGIVGVAASTVIANVLSAVIIVLTLRRNAPFEYKSLRSPENKRDIVKTVKNGLPVGVQGMVFAVSNIIIQSAVNSFGKEAIAGSAIVFSFECMGYYVIDSFNQASISFTGQNYINKYYNRCKKIYLFSLLYGVAGCMLVNVLFYLFKGNLIQLFTSNQTVTHFAEIRFTVVLLFQWVAGFYEITGATLRGMGRPFLPSAFTIFGTCVIRVLWVFLIFPLNRSYPFLLMIYPISWALTSVIALSSYYTVRKKSFDVGFS